jgi:hypothetical protein
MPAMTLGNMRSLGLKSVAVTCSCGRESIIDVSAMDGNFEVPALRNRMRCSACGGRPMFVRTN